MVGEAVHRAETRPCCIMEGMRKLLESVIFLRNKIQAGMGDYARSVSRLGREAAES